MAIDVGEVAHFLGDTVVFERARRYQEEGRVEFLSISGSHIEAVVRGSRDNRYQSAVSFYGGQLQGDCNCPYPLRCKHLGALLLEAIHAGEIPAHWQLLEGRSAELDDAGLDDAGPDDAGPQNNAEQSDATPHRKNAAQLSSAAPLGLRDLSQDTGSGRFAILLNGDRREYRTRLLGKAEQPEPGEEVLRLTVVPEEHGYTVRRELRLRITPMLQYLRKDGTPGALSPWRPTTECVARSSLELELLPVFNQAKRRRLPLGRLLSAAMLGGDVPELYATGPEEDPAALPLLRKLSFARLVVLELSFFPVRYTGREVLFLPCLSLQQEGGARRALDGHLEERLARWIETGKRRYLVERRTELLTEYLGRGGGLEDQPCWVGEEEGVTLLVDRRFGEVSWTTDPLLGRVLRDLAPGRERELSYPDILELQEQLRRREAEGSIRLTLPPREVEIRPLPHRKVVAIENGLVTVTNRLDFSYDDTPPEDRLLLLFYDNDRSSESVEFLADRCSELLDPFRPVRGAAGELFCEASLPEILERIAEPMIEAGAEVTFAGRPVRMATVDFALRVVSSGEDWFSITPVASVEGEEAEFPASGGTIETADGSVVVAANREELRRLMRRFGFGSNRTIRLEAGDVSGMADIQELLEKVEGDSPEVAKRAVEIIDRSRRRREAWRRLAEARNELDRGEPAGFAATLRPYQRRGFAWLEAATAEGFGPLLADDMGLGKTIQALALLQSRVVDQADASNSREPAISLVVAPPSTLENWRHESLKFAPALTPIIYHGSTRAELLDGAVAGRAGGTPLLITSYQTLLKDVEGLSQFEWDHLIFDEIQQIKNLRTKSYRAARTLTARRRLALSGTPLENSSLELYAVVDLLNPGFLGSRASYLRRFGVPIERDGNEEARRRLRELLTPLVLRRRKTEVAEDLPPKEEIPLYLSLPPAQRRVYERLRAEYEGRIRAALEEGRQGKRLMLILEGLTRLRQAAVDPRLLPSESSGTGEAAAATGKSAKLTALGELVPQIIAEEHRVLIFSQFVSLLSILGEWAERQGYAYCYLDGSMTPAQRKREIARFQEPDGPPIFLISLRAGGVGINLTAAEYVILIDPWWNPAVEDQAIDRSHRIGQTQPVTAYRLIASGTVEERIAAHQARKRSLAGDIVPDESTIISSLSEEEVLELFAEF